MKGDEVVLIDGGEDSPASWNALKTGLSNHKLQVGDIDRLIITHSHVDHIGMAERVAEAANCHVWVNPLVKEWAVNPKEKWEERSQLMSHELLGYFDPQQREFVTQSSMSMMESMHASWLAIAEDRIKLYDIEGEMEIDGKMWEVLHMPGHSQTQSTFFNAVSQPHWHALLHIPGRNSAVGFDVSRLQADDYRSRWWQRQRRQLSMSRRTDLRNQHYHQYLP